MENEKLQVVFPEGTTKAEVIVREGQAVQELAPKAPIKTDLSGVIGVPVEYLKKRVDTDQFKEERSVLIVDRENVSLSLIINEDDEYKRGTIKGKLNFHPKFVEFGINGAKVWTPAELGLFFKMNRSFFPDLSSNMKLVTDLMNFSGTVNNKIERSIKENGNQTDNFAQVVNSNLPPSFVLSIPIFKGTPAETLEVETFAKINGREVQFILLSPGATQALEEIRDKAIDNELSQVKEIAPSIAIIEV